MFLNLSLPSFVEESTMSEICYNGSHGTSLNLSGEIVKLGFKLGDGRAGNGVYFWVEGPLYLQLAKEWFIDRRNKHRYKELNPECAIIIVSLKAQPVEYVDFEDVGLKGQIYNMGIQQGINLGNDREIAKLYNLFISILEEELKTMIKIFTIRAAPPEGSSYPMKAIGAPLCCVARTLNSITINDVRSCGGV